MSKNIEEQVAEFNTEFIWDNAEKPSHEKSNWVRKALQERDRIAREEERERIIEVVKDACNTTEPEWIYKDIMEALTEDNQK